MTYHKNETAQNLDALVDDLQSALDKIDVAIAQMDGAQLFDTLCFVREYGDLSDTHHRILLDKLEKANAAESARGNHALNVCVHRDQASQKWECAVWDGQVDVLSKAFPTYSQAKAAGDMLHDFLIIAERAGCFDYQTPNAAECSDEHEKVPF
ncbi:MAG: hypothetical protein JJT99_08215 [Rhodobacteraceae bacterium]|nr:hypothetical protein [Paracoccaceae bacterium]